MLATWKFFALFPPFWFSSASIQFYVFNQNLTLGAVYQQLAATLWILNALNRAIFNIYEILRRLCARYGVNPKSKFQFTPSNWIFPSVPILCYSSRMSFASARNFPTQKPQTWNWTECRMADVNPNTHSVSATLHSWHLIGIKSSYLSHLVSRSQAKQIGSIFIE